MMLTDNFKPVLFFKNMTHHLPGLEYDFLKGMVNIILTRHPEEMLPSYAKVVSRPQLHDVGYKMHIDLLQYLQSRQIPVLVLDANRVLLNSRIQMEKLCKFIGISFDQAVQSWASEPRPEDVSRAQYWYSSIHKSIGFLPYQSKEEVFPEHLKPLLEEGLPYYHELLRLAL